MTAQDLIKKALIRIGVIGVGETPTADDANDSLDVLNNLLALWTSERLGFPINGTVPITLVSGTASYTVGKSTADVDSERPTELISGYLRQNNNDTPLNTLTKEQYNLIVNKTTPGTPDSVYYEATAPNGTFYFYPVPNITDTVYLHVTQPVAEISTLTTDISAIFPRNFISALGWMFSLELCAEFGKPVPTLVVQMAAGAKSRLESEAFARKIQSVNIATGLGKNTTFDFFTA